MIIKSGADAAVLVSAVRNLEKEDWWKSLEVEIKNVSKKPIYHLEVAVNFPEVINTELDGMRRSLVLPLTYGRRDLMRNGELAAPEDVPIRPGESYVVKIPEVYQEIRDRLAVVTRAGIRVYSISFGDGTGFMSGGVPFSFHRN